MYSLILLNGGVGSRVGADRPKQLLKVKGIPILVYSLIVADKTPEITEIVMNYPEGWLDSVKRIVDDYAIKTPVTYVDAGETRHESVAAMLPHCSNDHVVIHEAARPLVGQDDFARLIADPRENVSFMLKIPFTVAPVDPSTQLVTGSLERDRLRNVQLPQKFAKASLGDAHALAAKSGAIFTEDATLVASQGFPVHFMEGSDENFKVTTPLDLRLASLLLNVDEENYG